MLTSLYEVPFSLYSAFSPLYAVLIQFYTVALCGGWFIVGGTLFFICRVYCILRGTVFIIWVPYIIIYAVVNSLDAVLPGPFSRYMGCFSHCLCYIHGASLSLDLKRGRGCPHLNRGVYRHFDRGATCTKFRL